MLVGLVAGAVVLAVISGWRRLVSGKEAGH
jgi:hypothetical protein